MTKLERDIKATKASIAHWERMRDGERPKQTEYPGSAQCPAISNCHEMTDGPHSVYASEDDIQACTTRIIRTLGRPCDEQWEQSIRDGYGGDGNRRLGSDDRAGR